MANQNVLFYKATKAKYDALVEKNPLAIYFVEDIPAIYVGDVLFSVGSEVTSTFAGLMSPEDKIKLDKFIESGGNASTDEIQALWDELALKVNSTDVYTKQEVDNMISEVTENMVTSEEFTEVQSTITTLETKVETSTDNVDVLQTAIEQKADAAVVTELQTVVEQKADASTVTELQTIVEQKVDTETVELLETELKTYVDEQLKTVEITNIDDGEI